VILATADRQGTSCAVGRSYGPAQADSSAVHCQLAVQCSARSSRNASTRTRVPKRTTAVNSSTSGAGDAVMTRRTLGRWPVAIIGPSSRIRCKVCSVVHGVSCWGGLDPARVSARTWANWLGHLPGPDGPGTALGTTASRAAPSRSGRSRSCPDLRDRPTGRLVPRPRSPSYGGSESGTGTRRIAIGSGSGARRPAGRRRVGSMGMTAGPAGASGSCGGKPGGGFSSMSGVVLGTGDISGSGMPRAADWFLGTGTKAKTWRQQCHCHRS